MSLYLEKNSKLHFRCLNGGVVVRKNWRDFFVFELDTHRSQLISGRWTGENLAKELRWEADKLREIADLVEKLL